MAGVVAKAKDWVRRHGPQVGGEALVNFILPFALYTLTKASLGHVHALMASSAPPVAWSVVEFVRRRRVDALSLLVLAGIGLSLLAFLGGGGVRFLQLREKLVTGLIGLVFLSSAAFGRPLIYYLARATRTRRQAPDLADFEARRHDAGFKRAMKLMTLVWGFGLVADTAVGVVLVFTLSIRAYLIASPILGYSTMGLLSAWTFWYARRAKARGEDRRAAETAAGEAR